MKFSAMLGALVVALAAEGALAATNYTLDPSDPNAANICTGSGGVVVTDASGKRDCVVAQTCVPSNMPNPYVLDPADPNAAKVCTDACGTVSLDQTGQRICVRGGVIMRGPPGSREPHN